MSLIIKTKSLQTIYKSLGLEDRGRVQQFLGKTVADNLKKYVSFSSGVQSASTYPLNGGKQVVINVPYAQFQAGGKVMIGVYSHSPWAKRGERKVVTSKNLTYQGGGLRGSRPFERMKADKRDSILFQVAKYARRISDG
mgnify:CR=1 FL=1